MSWATAIAIGGSAALGFLGSQQAAGEQSAAADRAAAAVEARYRQSREDLAPWRTGGVTANQAILDYLGLGSGGSFIGMGAAPVMPTREQFTTAAKRGRAVGRAGVWGPGLTISGSDVPGSFDQVGFDAAMQKYLADNKAFEAAKSDPRFGSLLQPFTGADLVNEPGYQFGLSEGEKGIDRSALARGNFNSGATSKALIRFNQDYADTKYNEAFNRDLSSKNTTYGYLSGVSGTGANAAGQTAGLGANAANAVGGYLTGAGDARASGIVGGINAINSGVGSYLGYQQNQQVLDYLKNLRQPISSSSPGFNWGSSGYTGSTYTGGF